ncbi:hypothetical protein [Streptomyces sp. NPDC001833]|uniref:hypothetical protein n=1 Tax=Streptomyces sp. NPDC001833 TaxID=3154658 RepID=UPI0033184051
MLDRLVSYDSPIPCTAPCTPPPITFRHRPPPAPFTEQTIREVARRLSTVTAHPRLAAALAAALFTGASFQQLATARPGGYDDAAATLVLHGRARCTDGCATHRVPRWARVFLKAAVCFAGSRPARTSTCWPVPTTAPTCCAWPRRPGCARPSRLSVSARTGPVGGIQWDWSERKEAQCYGTMLTRQQFPPSS